MQLESTANEFGLGQCFMMMALGKVRRKRGRGVENWDQLIEMHHQPDLDSGAMDRNLAGKDGKYRTTNIISTIPR